MSDIDWQDIFVGVAAVADYRPSSSNDAKIKKDADTMQLELVKTPDILASVAALENAPFCVGFAAETHDVLDYARGKLEKKKLQLIAANHVGGDETGFGTPDNAITLIGKDSVTELPKQHKSSLARLLIKEIAAHFSSAH